MLTVSLRSRKNPMDAHFHSGHADAPYCWACTRSFFFFFRKGSVSVSPCVDVTNTLYICLKEAVTHERLALSPRILSASLGISGAFSSPILTSNDRPLETPLLRTKTLLSFPELVQFSSELRFFPSVLTGTPRREEVALSWVSPTAQCSWLGQRHPHCSHLGADFLPSAAY